MNLTTHPGGREAAEGTVSPTHPGGREAAEGHSQGGALLASSAGGGEGSADGPKGRLTVDGWRLVGTDWQFEAVGVNIFIKTHHLSLLATNPERLLKADRPPGEKNGRRVSLDRASFTPFHSTSNSPHLGET